MSASGAPRIIAVTSARADGATSVAVGLAARLAARGPVLLVDLANNPAEIAPLLQVDDGINLHHLGHRAQLGSITTDDVEEHVQWHEGIAVLPGITDPEHAWLLHNHFVTGVLDAVAELFPWAVLDLGRASAEVPWAVVSGLVLWVVSPSPLGLAAFDRRYGQLRDVEVPWLRRVRVVLNQVARDALADVEKFLAAEYGVSVAGSIPYEPNYWCGVQRAHSVQSLCTDVFDEARYVSWFGREALRTRRSLEVVVGRLEAEFATRRRHQLEV